MAEPGSPRRWAKGLSEGERRLAKYDASAVAVDRDGPYSYGTIDPIRILVVEGQLIIRDALAALLGLHHDLAIVGSVPSLSDATQAAAQQSVDIVVTELPSPGEVEALRRLTVVAPSTRVLVLSDLSTGEHVGRALRAGAQGFVSKRSSSDMLVSGIRRVYKGSGYMCPLVLDLHLRATATGGTQVEVQPPAHQLTRREREVLELISQGRTDRQIGETLELSIKTIHTYRTRIMEKLDVHSVGLLVRRGFQLGLLTP